MAWDTAQRPVADVKKEHGIRAKCRHAQMEQPKARGQCNDQYQRNDEPFCSDGYVTHELSVPGFPCLTYYAVSISHTGEVFSEHRI